jgi:hypothetical protein
VFEGKQQDTLETNISDRQTIIKFYNDSCNLVCTWIKGGIAGMNKVKPDSIEKEKYLIFILNLILFQIL